MIVTIHQPEHLPWLGYFNKMAKAELYVILDSVQFEKNYFQNRNRIIGTNGVQWLGIPVLKRGHTSGTIASTMTAEDCKWKARYLNTVQMSYKKHPFFSEVYPILDEAINIESRYLCDINVMIIRSFAARLGILPKVVRSSTLKALGQKSELILSICKETGASIYIAGPSGRDYLDLNSFSSAGIIVKFNDFNHPAYPQKRTDTFIPYLSALDLFMNCGFIEGKRIIMAGNGEHTANAQQCL